MSKKILVLVAVALLLAALFLVLRELALPSDETFEVSQIIDGDTFRLSTGEKVRLIGINTPETGQPFYTDATEKISQLIGNNRVALEKDVKDKDQYGRLLRYVYVGSTFVNLEIVRGGFAISYSLLPNVKYLDDFEDAEQEARIAQVGIWTPSNFSIGIPSFHPDAEGDDNGNLNDEYVVFENVGLSSINMTGWTVQDEANNFYVFTTFFLVNSSSVTLYTGSGTDTLTQVYWGSSKPIWNNDGDTLYLRDSHGYLVTFVSY
ncbi:MAG: lamin tail domain-containing protein [Thermoplasmata archaeon]